MTTNRLPEVHALAFDLSLYLHATEGAEPTPVPTTDQADRALNLAEWFSDARWLHQYVAATSSVNKAVREDLQRAYDDLRTSYHELFDLHAKLTSDLKARALNLTAGHTEYGIRADSGAVWSTRGRDDSLQHVDRGLNAHGIDAVRRRVGPWEAFTRESGE